MKGRQIAAPLRVVLLALIAVFPGPARAQITSGTITGTVHDASGGAIPGASVTLTSLTQGTATDAVTNGTGDFVFPTVRADSYSVKVSLGGFKTLERPNIVVHAGDRVSLGTMSLEVGALAETVTVSGEAPMIQSTSGERAFAITAESVQAIAVNGRNYNTLIALAPGIVAGTVNGLRANQNTFQIDGIGSMDTGNNGSTVSLTTDAVQEVKVLTSSYQAEYGRSAGGQITAVTKSGSNEFHGSLYADRRRDDLNANTWLNNRDGLPKARLTQSDEGFTIGGPLLKSRLFFFGNQEYQQRLNTNALQRVRVPTELERLGDFSQTLDNSGRLFNSIRDYTTNLPCSATDTRGCFQDGGVLGRIPTGRLYATGVNILKMYPLPNSPDTLSQGYNYVSQVSSRAPRRQDLARFDWQATPNWRFNGKYLRTSGSGSSPYGGGTTGFATNLPQFGSTNPCPCNYQVTAAADASLNSNTVLEANWGKKDNTITNYANDPAFLNKTSLGLATLPLLYPSAVQLNYPPQFLYSGSGSRVANPPTNATQYAPFLNANPTQQGTVNLTKLMGRHTSKVGLFFEHAVKPQTSRASNNATISFVNNASNPFDSGFPFANAALGVYDQYTQSSQWLQGNFAYTNVEWYVQDNWKMTNRLILDYGMRFYWMSPAYDTHLQASNFLPNKYDPSKAPRLYYPGIDPATNTRVGVDLLTGAMVPAVNVGRIIPNSGTLVGNGLYQAGQGIDKHLYNNQGIQYAPRVGFAYDITGEQKFIARGAAGIFYDRIEGNTVYPMQENPPALVAPVLFYGRLQDVTAGSGTLAPQTIGAIDYAGKIPTVYTYNVGIQKSLPWAAVVDVSYVGSRSRNLNTQVNINAPAYGAAYLAQNQDPTVGKGCSGCAATSSIPGANALPVDFLRRYQGAGNIVQVQTSAYANYNSVQTSLNRRFSKGVSFGVNYTLGKAMGTSSVSTPAGSNNFNTSVIGMPRPDSKGNQDKANYMPLDTDRRHNLVGTFVWQLPRRTGRSVVNSVITGWQLSGVVTAASGAPYTATYSIPGISPYTLTGTQQLESARIVINGNPGSGHSSDFYKQFDTSVFTTPAPGSVGLESGRNYLTFQPTRNLDLSISRFFSFTHNRRMEFRVDLFNALNRTQITGVNTTLNVTSLTNSTPTNLAEDSSGNVINKSGFGAVMSVAAARQVQLLLRFQF